MPPATVEIADFQQEVVEQSRKLPVVVDFWAAWCAPCKILGPVLERLAARSEGQWVLAKVDTDRFQDIAARYGIRGIPAVKMFVDGEVTAEFTGAMPEYSVVQWLQRSLPDPNRQVLEKAEALMAADNAEEAVPLLEEVLRKDPASHKARVLLAETLLSTDPSRALELVQPIEADSEYFQTAEAVRTVGRLAGFPDNPAALPDDPVKATYLEAIEALVHEEYARALDLFISVIRANRLYDDDGARRACIAVFTLLGDDDEITRSRRRDFSSALFV